MRIGPVRRASPIRGQRDDDNEATEDDKRNLTTQP